MFKPKLHNWIQWTEAGDDTTFYGYVIKVVSKNTYRMEDEWVELDIWEDCRWGRRGLNGPYNTSYTISSLHYRGAVILSRCPLDFSGKDLWINWLRDRAL